MSIPTLNTNGQTARKGGGMPPEGEHVAIIREAEYVTVGQNNTPAIDVKMEIAEGPAMGGTLFDKVWLTERAVPGAMWQFTVAGSPPPQGEWTPDPNALVGARVKVIVFHEPAQDDPTKKYARVRTWDRPDGAAQGGSTLPGGAQAPAAAPQGADADIPF